MAIPFKQEEMMDMDVAGHLKGLGTNLGMTV